MNQNSLRIACASAFWGDTPQATAQILHEPDLDYIAYDYLSEVTMAILAKLKSRDASAGYIADFMTDVIEPHAAEFEKRKIKIVCNAGGLNPEALAAKVREHLQSKNIALNVAAISGDALLSPEIQLKPSQKLVSANAYLGAQPVAAALAAGADIVITGRIVDTALVTGPVMHRFQKPWSDFDFLAQASLAGHIIECGTQCCGGNFTDWRGLSEPANVGFPVVEFFESGEFQVRKVRDTGGILSVASVAEQIVYEIGDPRRYILPDVVCDFSEVSLTPTQDTVRVTGARGAAPPGTYKALATFTDGWKISTTAFVGGLNAVEKARFTANALVARAGKILGEKNLAPFTEVRVETPGGAGGALMWIAAAHESPAALEILAKEIAPAATSLAPGLSNLLGGRAQAVPRVGLKSFTVPKDRIRVSMTDASGAKEIPVAALPPGEDRNQPEAIPAPAALPPGPTVEVPLEKLAYVRSGDKGNHVNLGVIARRPDWAVYLTQLTAERVAAHFQSLGITSSGVEAWALPGIHARNYLLKDCLGGGGAYSLHLDPQGKSFGQQLLSLQIKVPQSLQVPKPEGLL